MRLWLAKSGKVTADILFNLSIFNLDIQAGTERGLTLAGAPPNSNWHLFTLNYYFEPYALFSDCSRLATQSIFQIDLNRLFYKTFRAIRDSCSNNVLESLRIF